MTLAKSINSIRTGAVLYASDYQHIAKFYVDVAGFRVCHSDCFFIHLETRTFQLVVLEADRNTIQQMTQSRSVNKRVSSPIKLVFFVDNISDVRGRVADLGGKLCKLESDSSFGHYKVCDGQDPEGNVFQLREHDQKVHTLHYR